MVARSKTAHNPNWFEMPSGPSSPNAPRQITFWLTRIVFLRYLGIIYFTAFSVAFWQVCGRCRGRGCVSRLAFFDVLAEAAEQQFR